MISVLSFFPLRSEWRTTGILARLSPVATIPRNCAAITRGSGTYAFVFPQLLTNLSLFTSARFAAFSWNCIAFSYVIIGVSVALISIRFIAANIFMIRYYPTNRSTDWPTADPVSLRFTRSGFRKRTWQSFVRIARLKPVGVQETHWVICYICI